LSTIITILYENGERCNYYELPICIMAIHSVSISHIFKLTAYFSANVVFCEITRFFLNLFSFL
jgi:hypothetical protein